MKALIAYYSRSGSDLVNGSVQFLKRGNTESAAAILRKLTNADCYQIKPYQDYPEDYYRCIDLARQDLLRGIRPSIIECPYSLRDYDVVYLGYPNCWGTMPAPVFTFLEQNDFTGKIIKPFCTYDSIGISHSEADLKRICPGAEIARGLTIKGTAVKKACTVIEDWIREEPHHQPNR